VYRVLRIINRFNLGGPTYNVGYLSRYLHPDFETMLVGGAKDETEGSSEFIVRQLGLEPRIIPEMRRSISPAADRAAYKKIRQLIREFQPHIVHTHASKAGALGRLAASSCKVPVIVHTFHGHVFHSYFGKLSTSFYKSVERFLARRSDAIVAISARQKEELSLEHNICPPEKIEIIPLGFDLSRFRENTESKRRKFRSAWQLADDELALVIVGRLVPVKNHALFLEALKELSQRSTKKIRAFIVGDGESRSDVEAKARELQLPFRSDPQEPPALLTFTSWIKDVDEVYAGADLVALSSWNEGTPVSLIEAQAAGRAIVSTDTGGIGDVVVPGQTALLSEPGDGKKFAEHLLHLAENDAQREAFGARGWEQVGKHFHYTRLVSDMEKLYRRLLNEKGIR